VIVLDASVLIAHLDERDALHARAAEALLGASGEPLGCSTITLAEVLVGPARSDRLDAARRALRELGIEELRLDDEAPARLAALRAGTALKLPDCGVLLAAQEAGPGSLITFDDRLAQAARRLGLALA
jgi:predicted nucleic acid-binding protein